MKNKEEDEDQKSKDSESVYKEDGTDEAFETCGIKCNTDLKFAFFNTIALIIFALVSLLYLETFNELKQRVTNLELAVILWYSGLLGTIVIHLLCGLFCNTKNNVLVFIRVAFHLAFFAFSCFGYSVRTGDEFMYMVNLDPEKY